MPFGKYQADSSENSVSSVRGFSENEGAVACLRARHRSQIEGLKGSILSAP